MDMLIPLAQEATGTVMAENIFGWVEGQAVEMRGAVEAVAYVVAAVMIIGIWIQTRASFGKILIAALISAVVIWLVFHPEALPGAVDGNMPGSASSSEVRMPPAQPLPTWLRA